MINDSDYESIIPTAILTAYPRTLTDIPFSKEIFSEIEKQYSRIDQSLIIDRLAVELEARHKLIGKLLAKEGSKQILELASGFSSRGLTYAANSIYPYIELDLPQVATMKRRIVKAVETRHPANLHILGGNALRQSDLLRATRFLVPNEPITIVNEGLLRYLDFAEKAKLAKNIRTLLEISGGVWISGDGSSKRFLQSQNQTMPALNIDLGRQSRKDLQSNSFASPEEFRLFFQQLGFTVEFNSYKDVESELSAPKLLGISAAEVSQLLSHAAVVIFRLTV